MTTGKACRRVLDIARRALADLKPSSPGDLPMALAGQNLYTLTISGAEPAEERMGILVVSVAISVFAPNEDELHDAFDGVERRLDDSGTEFLFDSLDAVDVDFDGVAMTHTYTVRT